MAFSCSPALDMNLFGITFTLGTNCFSIFNKMNFRIFWDVTWLMAMEIKTYNEVRFQHLQGKLSDT